MFITINGKEYARAKDLAVVFGSSTNTVYRWVREGKLPQPRRQFGKSIWSMDKIKDIIDKAQPSEKAIRAAVANW